MHRRKIKIYFQMTQNRSESLFDDQKVNDLFFHSQSSNHQSKLLIIIYLEFYRTKYLKILQIQNKIISFTWKSIRFRLSKISVVINDDLILRCFSQQFHHFSHDFLIYFFNSMLTPRVFFYFLLFFVLLCLFQFLP